MSKTKKELTSSEKIRLIEAHKGSEILNDEILTTLLSLDNYKGVFLAELIDIYTSTLPPICEQLGQALQSRRYEDMSKLAHKAKGMSLNLGTKRLIRIFETIETGDTEEVVMVEDEILGMIQEEFEICSQELREQWYMRKDFAKRRRKA